MNENVCPVEYIYKVVKFIRRTYSEISSRSLFFTGNKLVTDLHICFNISHSAHSC